MSEGTGASTVRPLKQETPTTPIARRDKGKVKQESDGSGAREPEKIACPEGYEVVGYLLVPSTMIRSADDRNKLRHSANRLKEWLHDLTNYEAKRKLNPNALAPPYPFSKTLPDNPFRKEIVEIKDEVEEELIVNTNPVNLVQTAAADRGDIQITRSITRVNIID